MMRPHRLSLALAPVVCGAALLSAAAQAQTPPAAEDPEATVVADLVVVAPAYGPAWWKVSKGNSVVWILGLPPGRTPAGMAWDQRTLERRLNGAGAVLAPTTEWGEFRRRDKPPLLTAPLARKVAPAATSLGEPSWRYATVSSVVMDMRFRYYAVHKLTHDTHKDIYLAATRAGVRIIFPRQHKHVWRSRDLSAADPEIAACMLAVVNEVETPPQRSRAMAAHWAVGDVQKMLAAAPPSVGYVCRRFWPGHWERTIAFQTKAIGEALKKPGKVVAVVHTGHLVAENGILQRLRSQGYTIADPTKPLSD